ncbi:MAG: histidine phosphatase family protein [Oscillospiraceae bacterium]|nr:histidine phosphatase family protein [Oscillospiraceae bacterium]
MTRIYFVRHAQPDPSGGHNPTFPLTAVGRRDSQAVAWVLEDKDIAAVYASEYIRTAQTLEYYSMASHKPINVIKGIHERVSGDWKSLDTNYSQYIVRQWNDRSLKAQGGESLDDVRARVIPVIEGLIEKHDGEAVAVGIHGMALGVILSHYIDDFTYSDFADFVDMLPYVLCADFEEGRYIGSHVCLAIRRGYPRNYMMDGVNK